MRAVQVAKLEGPEAFDNSHEGAAPPEEQWSREAESPSELRGLARFELESIFGFLDGSTEGRRYSAVETELIRRVFRLGRLLVVLFLTLVAERLEVPLHLKRGRKEFRRQPAKPRLLGTFFGKCATGGRTCTS